MSYYDPFAPQAWSQGGPRLQAQVAGAVALNDAFDAFYAVAGDRLRMSCPPSP